ncbi:MAG: DUF1700 domain-containing protein [Clostridia bacterium]|nr:DUF1700 domain-containing protein [Clostridia bacterium]MBQ3652129.1 DUF1700 domain-containing protein [Clostridia bacterium]MBQ7755104.1 DUF1700 domain-containing protein [Clostridia bacterium]MBR0422883.1 DUF1700 domain-containing protein [Clostridia bacterium]
MSRDAFIGELRHRMAGLPQETVERTVDYYGELIADSMEDGLTEEEAVARLGSLDEIVASVVKDTPLTQIVQTRVQEGKKKGISGWVILLLVLGAPVWLPVLIAVLAVLFALFIALWAVVIALWAVVAAVILTGLVALVAGVVELCRLHLPQGLVLLGGGLVCLGLCALLFLLMKLITVGTVKLCKWLWVGIKSLFVGKKSKE